MALELAEEGEDDMSVHIADKAAVEAKLADIRSDGAKELHVVSDYDGTLTQAFDENKKVNTVIAQLRNEDYFDDAYKEKAFALYDKYHPYEIDESLPMKERAPKMQAWWEMHLALMIDNGLDKEIVQDIIEKKRMKFRDGAMELIDILHDKEIPLLIFSASFGEVIEGYLRNEGRLYDNVHVIANFFNYDGGKVLGYKNKIVHTFNKNEAHIKGTPYESIIRERRNVLLLGNTLSDVGMAKGFEHDVLLQVGFLNENAEWNLPLFGKEYDVVITDDGPMDWVLDAVKSLP